jgi:hypothetical protein
MTMAPAVSPMYNVPSSENGTISNEEEIRPSSRPYEGSKGSLPQDAISLASQSLDLEKVRPKPTAFARTGSDPATALQSQLPHLIKAARTDILAGAPFGRTASAPPKILEHIEAVPRPAEALAELPKDPIADEFDIVCSQTLPIRYEDYFIVVVLIPIDSKPTV